MKDHSKEKTDIEDVRRILDRVDQLPEIDNRTPEEIIGYDEHGLPVSIDNAVDDFLESRHREWEINMGPDLPCEKEERSRKSPKS